MENVGNDVRVSFRDERLLIDVFIVNYHKTFEPMHVI